MLGKLTDAERAIKEIMTGVNIPKQLVLNEAEIRREMDIISRELGVGEIASSIQNNFFGLNQQINGSPVPGNNEQYGLTFFTRPNLNLMSDNLEYDRLFMPLQTTDPHSIYSALRAYLSPQAALLEGWGHKHQLVDPRQAFIPLLSNNLLTISGWPEVLAGTYTSQPGKMNEQFSYIDGFPRDFSVFNITASFRNIMGNPITLMFHLWVRAALQQYAGLMMPWPDDIIEDEVNYDTRIYRMTLDPSRNRVLSLGACGAAFPTSSGLAGIFDFNSESATNRENEQISVQFQCMGFEPMDPILIHEFNTVVGMFNPTMLPDDVKYAMNKSYIDFDDTVSLRADKSSEQEVGPWTRQYVKLTPAEKRIFNYRGYPRIDPQTMELQWWVPKVMYEQTMLKHRR